MIPFAGGDIVQSARNAVYRGLVSGRGAYQVPQGPSPRAMELGSIRRPQNPSLESLMQAFAAQGQFGYRNPAMIPNQIMSHLQFLSPQNRGNEFEQIYDPRQIPPVPGSLRVGRFGPPGY